MKEDQQLLLIIQDSIQCHRDEVQRVVPAIQARQILTQQDALHIVVPQVQYQVVPTHQVHPVHQVHPGRLVHLIHHRDHRAADNLLEQRDLQ